MAEALYVSQRDGVQNQVLDLLARFALRTNVDLGT
jgi:hypothetical protein